MKLLRALRGKGSQKQTNESVEKASSPASEASEPNGFWINVARTIQEPFSGAWQQNKEIKADDGLKYPVVFACISRIAEDISKVPLRLEKRDSNGIYHAARGDELTRLLKRPNGYQDRQKFIAQWEACIQSRGNAYILKAGSGDRVTSLHVLSPDLVTPLVTPSGSVYYRIQKDNLTGIKEEMILSASDIIHDRINCFFHPLIGLSPLYAAALNVWLGMKSQEQQQKMFANGATPGGVLIFPGNLDQAAADKVRRIWETGYTGENVGKTAILGDGVTYQRLSIPAEDAQLIEQLRFGAEMICSVFHVPPYKVGIGPMPSISDVEGLNQIYFSDCLQSRITAIQNVLDSAFGLELSEKAFRFDLESLILMDSKTRMEVATGLRKGGLATIDEGRKRVNLPPIFGGDDVYLQQQDHSLKAIAERDARYLSSPDKDVPDTPEVVQIDIDEAAKHFMGALSYE